MSEDTQIAVLKSQLDKVDTALDSAISELERLMREWDVEYERSRLMTKKPTKILIFGDLLKKIGGMTTIRKLLEPRS